MLYTVSHSSLQFLKHINQINTPEQSVDECQAMQPHLWASDKRKQTIIICFYSSS